MSKYTQNYKFHTKEELEEIVESIRNAKNVLMREANISEDDLWILISDDLHMEIIENFERVPDGPERLSKTALCGMHAIHDGVKKPYVIPKKRLVKENNKR